METNTSMIVVDPAAAPTAAVIWLHGLGADGHDFAGIQQMLGLPPDHGIRFIFPHAPLQPVTINGGYVMRAWYDIYDIGPDKPEDQSGLESSERILLEIVGQLGAEGIAPERIVLAGFSQGGAVSLFTAMRSARVFAGVLALSTYLPAAQLVNSTITASARNIPVWMAHGTQDEVVPMYFGELSRDRLLALGVTVDWHSYDMAHSVVDPEISDIGIWLTRILAASNP